MKYIIMITILLAVGVVWGQESPEVDEFVSSDNMLKLSYPAGWEIREIDEFPGVEMVNEKTIFEKIDNNDSLAEGEVQIGVILLPAEFVATFMQINLEDDLDELAVSFATFIEANSEKTTTDEPELITLENEQEAVYLLFTEEKTEGAYILMNHVEGFLTLVLLNTYEGELTEEIEALALAVAASIEYGEAEATVEETGSWSAETDFGSFSFTLTEAGIPDVTFTFRNFTCGAGTQSGSIQVTYSVPVTIKDGEFMLTLDMSPPPMPGQMSGPRQTLTIQGTFSEDGQSAEGTWRAVSGSASCGSGSWDMNP